MKIKDYFKLIFNITFRLLYSKLFLFSYLFIIVFYIYIEIDNGNNYKETEYVYKEKVIQSDSTYYIYNHQETNNNITFSKIYVNDEQLIKESKDGSKIYVKEYENKTGLIVVFLSLFAIGCIISAYLFYMFIDGGYIDIKIKSLGKIHKKNLQIIEDNGNEYVYVLYGKEIHRTKYLINDTLIIINSYIFAHKQSLPDFNGTKSEIKNKTINNLLDI